MNFLPGKVEEAGERLIVAIDSGPRLTLARRGGTAKPGDPVTIGIRPEHLVPVATGGVSVELVSTEVLGAETVLHARTASGTPLTATQRGIVGSARGDRLSFDLPDAFTHVFDKQGATLEPARPWTDDYMRKIA
jgi:multiple sugar transport system ATP-binding protein